jgi:hypothetical protein
MKNLLIACAAAALAPAFSFATPTDDVKAAAAKLAEAADYSWITRAANAGGASGDGARAGFASGAASGVTEKAGYAVITRQGQNGAVQIVRKDDKIVVKNQQGVWVFPEELTAQTAANNNGAAGAGGGGKRSKGGGQRKAGGQRGGAAAAGASDLAGGAPLPTEDIAALVAGAKNLQGTEGVITGELTAEAVAARLTRAAGRAGRQAAATAPKDASGTVSFWLKDGVIEKYELHVKASIQVRGDNAATTIDRTTTTEIMDVGSTKVDVPDAAKTKLGA